VIDRAEVSGLSPARAFAETAWPREIGVAMGHAEDAV
jgi:hypothetical protein